MYWTVENGAAAADGAEAGVDAEAGVGRSASAIAPSTRKRSTGIVGGTLVGHATAAKLLEVPENDAQRPRRESTVSTVRSRICASRQSDQLATYR